MSTRRNDYDGEPAGILGKLVRLALENRPVVLAVFALALLLGLRMAPFNLLPAGVERDPVPVDAIPDLGENQQIIFTSWPGHSPQDIEDQITYPLTSNLLSTAQVRTVRALSMFGFSTIYVIFNDESEFYDTRSRLLERLASLPANLLPDGVKPVLGPDATALGQVFWYTLEGRDKEGRPTGGWDPQELRSIQDWTVRPSLMSVEGVSEVASIGGHVREIVIEADPLALERHGLDMGSLLGALRQTGNDTGGGSVEINRVEYLVRGIGFLRSPAEIEESVVAIQGGQPVRVRDLARVSAGPAPRRGVLDKDGVEAVGGVVVARFGANPKAVIDGVKRQIAAIAPSLPVRDTDSGDSRVSIVPFYDRSILIGETLGTLNSALVDEILVTALVILFMVGHIRSSLLIAGLLPAAVLLTFVAMRLGGVDANIVALSGIAIAIGTMVDMGIVISEGILREQQLRPADSPRTIVDRATRRVAGPVLTALATTVVSFLPVFTLQAAEGKLFRPLAFTKTFALLSALLLALFLLPTLAEVFFFKSRGILRSTRPVLGIVVAALGGWIWPAMPAAGTLTLLLAGSLLFESWLARHFNSRWMKHHRPAIVMLLALVVLSEHWLPLGGDRSFWLNLLFTGLLLGGLLAGYGLLLKKYEALLGFFLNHAKAFLALPLLMLVAAGWIWHRTGSEFMPALDEGSFLFMPSTMPHASLGEVNDVLSLQDRNFRAIPEIEEAVGKLGRVDSALDPAPLSMIETIIRYRPEFLQDSAGHALRFEFTRSSRDTFRSADGLPVPAADGLPYVVQGRFPRDKMGRLVPDPGGRYFRLWRPALDPGLNAGREAWPGIRNPDDIWQEILSAGELTGVTSAPKLQPISTRLVMLQSGMRAPMGVKLQAPDLESLHLAALAVESVIRDVPQVYAPAVVADRVVGKPYLEFVPDRLALAERGVSMEAAQAAFSIAVGGVKAGTLYEGRERYDLRLRYPRELRDSPEDILQIQVRALDGALVPLASLGSVRVTRGPQVIKSEDTFLTGYVLFDGQPGLADGAVIKAARRALDSARDNGRMQLPSGVTWRFAGTWENQARAQRRLLVVIPVALVIILLFLWLQFKRLRSVLLVFSGILVAFSGGFLLIWAWGQPWFFDIQLAGSSIRELFGMKPIFLSVAVWVGFLALFGISTDDGVLMTSFLEEAWSEATPATEQEARAITIAGASRRSRACLMTTATTVLALLPVLGSTGRGSDVMVPMAIPVFGGMLVEVLTMFTVPVLYHMTRTSISNKPRS